MKYSIGEIYIDAEGVWTVNWWGEHAEQGGINFTKGNASSKDLGDLFSWVQHSLEQSKETFLKKIGEKNDT